VSLTVTRSPAVRFSRLRDLHPPDFDRTEAALPPDAACGAVVESWLAEAGLLPAAGVTLEPAPDFTARGGTSSIYRVMPRDSRDSGAGAPEPIAIVKAAPPGDSFERCAREYDALRLIGSDIGLPVPRLIAGRADAVHGALLLLEAVPGIHPSLDDGWSPEEAHRLLMMLAQMHRRWRDRSHEQYRSFLPVWGAGTAGHTRPHARRAARFRRQLPKFIDMYRASLTSESQAHLRSIASSLEATLASAASWPQTLMHGDVHLENLIVGPDPQRSITLLDWQSVSSGPGLVDVVRFVTESVRWPAADPGAVLRELIDDWAEASREPAGAEGIRRFVPHALDIVIAGFVSGWAARPFSDRVARLLCEERFGALL